MTPNRPGEASLEPDWGAMQAKWAAWHAGPPEILYHYTTAQGLLGMLSSNRLWATNARFLNDPTEIEYAANIVRQLLSTATQEYDRKVAEMESGKNILERFSNKLFLSPAIKTWSADILKVMDEQEHVYIVCFCVEGDLLSQWRGYGATGSGYAVGFRSAAIQHEPGDPAFPRVLLRKVIYKKDDQSAIVREWLDGVYGAELAWRRKHDDKLQVFKKTGSTSWQNFLETFKPDSPLRKEFQTFVAASKERLQQGRLSFQRFLTECLISFKDPNYREENEWRAIQFGHPGVEVCFRDANGRITPYCKLDITHAGQPPGKLPIQSIRYGPTLETREASRGLKMLVSASGYPNVSVEPSNIRFRTR